MKKVLAFLLTLTLLCSFTLTGIAYADETDDPNSDLIDPGDDQNPDDSDLGDDQDPENPDPENPDPENPDPENPDPENPDPEEPDPGTVEHSLTVEPPTKVFYTVGEAPDYSGGAAIYTKQTVFRFALTKSNCSGLDTSTPGNKVVTVTIHGLQAYFRVIVLSAEEPITSMKDITYKHWSYQYFGPVMKAGYFEGDQNKNLNPDAPITRAEMAKIIYQAWKTDPTVMTESANAAKPFPDVAKDKWYYEPIEACRKAGILRGMDTGECKPDDPITRQDAVLMLMRIQYTDEELAAIDIKSAVAASGVNPTDFDQVADYAAAAMAAALGDIIKGDQNHAILPRHSITRADTAAIFQRMFLADYEWESPVRVPLIYLSPSNQFANSYAAGNTTEGAQMTLLAQKVQALLEAEGYEVVVAERSTSIKQRSADANAMGADLYIPIHSNAGGKTTGTYVFYNGSIAGCEEFSREIFNRVAALTGTAYSTSRHKEDYLCLLPDGAPFQEVMNPTMPLAYIEVEFHDKADKALWIINNTDKLARAIADGVIAYSEAHIL